MPSEEESSQEEQQINLLAVITQPEHGDNKHHDNKHLLRVFSISHKTT